MNCLMLAIAIVSEVIATNLLKASEGLSHWAYGIASISFYAIAGFLLSILLKQMNVGIAYAIWAGAGITLISLASIILWNQPLDRTALSGVALIAVGVALITIKPNSILS